MENDNRVARTEEMMAKEAEMLSKYFEAENIPEVWQNKNN